MFPENIFKLNKIWARRIPSPGLKRDLAMTDKPSGSGGGRPPFSPHPGLPGYTGKQPSSRVTLSRGGAKVGVSFKAKEQQQEEEKKRQLEKEAQTAIPLEDRVFAALGTKDIPESAVFAGFIEKIAPRVALADTSWTILEAFSNIDATAEKVSQALRANAYYEYLFTKTIESISKREEMPSLEGAVVLLGMQNFRNLILALQMSRTVHGTHIEFDKEGKIKVSPKELLKYSIKTEEQLLASRSEYSDMGFAAGLLFDFLAQIIGAIAEDKKRAMAFLDSSYSHGLRTAQIAGELAKLIPDFAFQKYLFSVCLIHDLGKVCMGILDQEYFAFSEMAKKNEWPRAVRLFVEQERFGTDHAVIGSHLCHQFRILRPIDKVVRYHHAPFLLKSRNRNLQQLSSLLCLATNIASNFKKVDKADDPVFALWKGPEIQDFRLDSRAIMAAVSKVTI
ncbi:MAG: hypothetical protein A2X94_17370 [Bdellovibrionales bacterium GWB1_55_8]|nr:MAG: hypothetical protein A2X94_17370 [Bdellovibrionales bacterium GWB1_55_8]